jgi:alpha-tubulin suppressor-like RCC1 family protein
VSTGETHACGRTAASVVYCWGDNYRGALGDGTTARDRATAVLVTGGVRFALIAVGSAHNCGLNTASVAYCWGGNQLGEIGDGTTTDRSTPVPVAGDLSFAAVSAGSLHSCGVTAAGAAYCWGQNIYGQLGDGTTTDRASPALVAGGVTFVAVSTGYSHTCGVTAAGAAYCWGSALSGELGDGTATFRRTTPVLVAGGLSFTAVSAGARYTCGVTDAHTAYCWGDDQFGEIGDGVTPNGGHSTPTLVAGGLSFAAVSAGRLHTCGVTVAGAAYCWGAREFGQLGDGATTGSQQCYDGDLGLVDCSVVPVPVAGGLTFAAVSTGNASACGVTTEGAAYCWGANNAGQLGDGTKTNQAIPVRVMQ